MSQDRKTPSSSAQRQLKVVGMTCQNCVRHVREAILSVPGVESVDVSLDAGRATVRPKPDADPTATQLIEAVRQAGFEAEAAAGDASESADDGSGGWNLPLITGLVATAPLMLGEWVFHWGMETWFRWTAFVLASVVQGVAGRAFFQSAWRQLKQGRSNMDTLVSIGSGTAYGLSVYLLVRDPGAHLFFMEAASIITLISLGHWLEARSAAKASTALKALMHLAPVMAVRQEADGTEREVAVAELAINDAVVLRPGDVIPTDGAVIEGDSSVDESMLTGESMPVDKGLHDRLYAGTTNLNGRLLMMVTGMGEETALARIIQAVRRAQDSRSGIQRLVDRVSQVFVPAVVAVALGTAVFWAFFPETARTAHEELATHLLWSTTVPEGVWAAALIAAAAVLIIACPCAMGLATPVAITVGSNTAARRGILLRDSLALENAGTIDTVVFDKTGTLTRGQPRLVRSESFLGEPDRPQVDEMPLAVALARFSNHPISRAISQLDQRTVPLSGFRELRGKGLEARWKMDDLSEEESVIRLGSLPWLESCGVGMERSRNFASQWSVTGATLIGLSIDHWLMAVYAIRDEIKPGVREMVEQLRLKGLEVYLVSGDQRTTVDSIAREAGIEPANVHAETSPAHKPEIVRELQAKGRRVAFAGDGINDAPALEQADLGIAVSKASDIARETADIILLKTDLQGIPEAIGLSQAVLRTIKQNLFWAFAYNIAAIPLAAFGFLSPVICAAAMGMSDLIVIGNAMRLYRWKPFFWRRLRKQLELD